MNRINGIFYAVVSSSSFGLIPLFSIPLLQDGMPSINILFYRMSVAAAIMGLAIPLTGRSFAIGRGDCKWLVLLGVLYAATSMALLYSYDYIPSGVATTVHFLYPVVVMLIMTLLLGERVSMRMLAAAAMSIAGVATLSLTGENGLVDLRGIGLVLITVFTYGLYIVMVRRSSVARLDALVLTFYVLLVSGAIYFAASVFSGGIRTAGDWSMWSNVLLLALLSTVVSNLTLVLAVEKVGSTMTSVLGCMEPLTAMLVGVFGFGENFGAGSAAGLLLVLLSVFIVIVPHRKRAAA